MHMALSDLSGNPKQSTPCLGPRVKTCHLLNPILVWNQAWLGKKRVSVNLNLLLMFCRSFFKRPFNTSSKVQIRRQPTQTTQKDPNGKVRNENFRRRRLQRVRRNLCFALIWMMSKLESEDLPQMCCDQVICCFKSLLKGTKRMKNTTTESFEPQWWSNGQLSSSGSRGLEFKSSCLPTFSPHSSFFQCQHTQKRMEENTTLALVDML